MRQVLSISLPAEKLEALKEKVKNGPFPSVSAYISNLIEEDPEDDWISEEELLKSINRGRKEHAEGRTVTAESLADLL